MGNRRALAFAVVVFTAVVAAAVGLGCGKKNNGKPTDAPGTGVDAAACTAAPLGQACMTGTDCCSGNCDPVMKLCSMAACTAANGACQANTDCCSTSCVNNVCGVSCTNDNQSCTSNGQCCSGTCGTGGKCTPLNTTCLTTGNACTAGGEACCSGNCNASGHCGPASFCVQNGDACAHDSDCCGGLCTIATGNTIGTCGQPQVGSTNCSGLDGSVCNDCGACCSRLCEVYQPTGVKICQPAEGCRVDGDLCYTSDDCCGGPNSGLPGQGNVTCLRANPTDPVGICRNPISCDPEGDVCHYKNFVTCGNSSARNDCCGAPGNSGVCKLDILGVPRCYGLGSGCQMQGSACSNALDCCNGNPCVFNGSGYQCSGSNCIMAGSGCTQTADCCNGETCVFQSGQITGTCGGGMMSCQQLGQMCNTSMPCCMGQGTCTDVATGMACGATETMGCTCQNPIF